MQSRPSVCFRATVLFAVISLTNAETSRTEDVHGDQNGDGAVDICDVVISVNRVYRNAPSETNSDVSLIGSSRAAEVQRVVNYVFNDAPPCIPRVHCGVLRLNITDDPPSELARDHYALIDAGAAGHMLTVQIGHGGGCLIHGHKVFMSPSTLGNESSKLAHLYPQHENNGDGCEAFLMPRLPVDLSPLIRLVREQYGPETDSVKLRIYDYDPTVWRDVMLVLPSVEQSTDSVIVIDPSDTLEAQIAAERPRDHD